ncbi:hypothetical protein, partial [Caldimonas tepidiphila]|uniref:hypothetical protein n=1 Tax=Caldimonas tepidiphila TaxID=2315841 RepID=UPI00196A2BA6
MSTSDSITTPTFKILGPDGNPVVVGSSGNDIIELSGTSSSYLVNAGAGSDVLIYEVSKHLAGETSTTFNGGSGTDTVRLVFETTEAWLPFKDAIKTFYNFLLSLKTNASGEVSGNSKYTLVLESGTHTATLTVSLTEVLQVWVGGVEIVNSQIKLFDEAAPSVTITGLGGSDTTVSSQ